MARRAPRAQPSPSVPSPVPAVTPRILGGVFLVLLVLGTGGLWWMTQQTQEGDGPVREINNRELAQLIESGVKVIDIREPWEWAQTGVIEGSHLITAFDTQGRIEPDFVPRLAEVVALDEEVVFICRTGSRTGVLTPALVDQLGFEKVHNVTYGILPWIQSGGEVVACSLEDGVPRC